MIFPLENMVEFKEGMYEITVAASRRAYQLAMTKDPLLEENDGKVVSLAAKQLFTGDVKYSIEESKR
ncbi:DNA-directed RNA polymerase subunit omega [Treponema sp.]|uniref:DNA-directed RNA polymerase subunit omega n=1 Tax=Treponema sp. TaxID=166 RepID=UPI0025DC67D6|nr:DNA-directed RNA polymerase subunit omega [Treponema sp.]MCR5218751.1 DNA-directed RNA polymerase subunit omega [Treponema sp.]